MIILKRVGFPLEALFFFLFLRSILYFSVGVFTPKNKGIYNLVLMVRSGGQVGDTDLYLKKPGTGLKYLLGHLHFCRPAYLRKLKKQSKHSKNSSFFCAKTHSKKLRFPLEFQKFTFACLILRLLCR